jgi:polyhydroxybutyrate depolymerase
MHHLQGAATDGESDFALQTLAESRGFLYAAPSGQGGRWNATDACCDTSLSADDTGYLAAVVAVVKTNANVDAKRVFFFGHSNGGFMAHRMACDHADVIAAAVSISGAMWSDTSRCEPAAPVSVLEVHATKDPVIAYGGGTFIGGVYPAATTTASDWATFDACSSVPTAGAALTLSGSATTVASYAGCSRGAEVALWSVDVANHLPMTGAESTGHVLDWLLAHPKP